VHQRLVNKPIEDILKTQCVAVQPSDAYIDGGASIPNQAEESHIVAEIPIFMPKCWGRI
jgi:hypothetical protein